MRLSFAVPIAALKATALFSSPDSTREILNGVAVEFTDSAHVTFIGTDSRRLLAIRHDCAVGLNIRPQDFPAGRIVVIPSHVIELIPDDLPRASCGSVWLAVEVPEGVGNVEISISINYPEKFEIRAIAIIGDFPKWRNVFDIVGGDEIPPATDIFIDGKLLEAFNGVSALYGGGVSSLRFFRDKAKPADPIVITLHTLKPLNAIGCIMPMRGGDEFTAVHVPEWVRSAKG